MLPVVAGNLRLTFPVALVESGDQVLQGVEVSGLADTSDLVLETVRKTLIVLAG